MKTAPRIAVIGERDASHTLAQLAEHVGREIAQRAGIVICGGMGGVMEAASRGCREAGGIVVGIIPTDDARDANRYVTIPIVTGMGEARNAIIARSALAVIAIGGSYGTLSEIALALRFGVPVIGLHTWVFSRSLPGESDPVIRVTSAHEAVNAAWDAIGPE